MANWASVAEVLAYTGSTVTDAQITAANGVIDLFAGVTDTTRANLGARDLRLLKQATAYQTVWQIGQVDPFTRTDVKTADQDGADFTLSHDDALLLAPLAKRCLDRLSWHRARSVKLARGTRRYATLEAYSDAWLADEVPGSVWVPL